MLQHTTHTNAYFTPRIHIIRLIQMAVFIAVIISMSSCRAPVYEHPQGELQGCGPTLRLDIVSTEAARQRGLMGIDQLPPNYGMLFVFADTIQPAFWMKDTRIPLEVVFMSNMGEIKAITPMQPYTETIHEAPEPLPYALEVPLGWMAKHDVNVGDTCTLVLPETLIIE